MLDSIRSHQNPPLSMSHPTAYHNQMPISMYTGDIESKTSGSTKDARKAELGDKEEREGTLKQLIQAHRPAWLWSMLISCALIMEGYDLGSINGFYGQSQFIESFGQAGSNGEKSISAPWQTGISNASLVGQFIGLCVGGFLVEKVGYRKVYMGGLTWIAIVFFCVFFAPSLIVLAVGEGLLGMGLGIFQSLTNAYASEILPMSLRGYLTSWSNANWGFGLLLAAGVVRGALSIQGEWAYRLPWALQWMWPPVLLVVAYFAPESPWWLSRKGRDDEARNSIRRLRSAPSPEHIDRTLALIKHTNLIEEQAARGTSYLECFRGDNLRRTEVACMMFVMQLACGAPMNGFAVVFLQRAGLSEDASFDFNTGMMANFIVGTVISWLFIPRFGRKTIVMAGMCLMCLIALLIGVLGTLTSNRDGSALGVGALLVIQTFAFNISIGPLAYCIIAEVGSTRLRSKTVALARICYVLTNIVTNILQPRMISEDEWNWGAKCGFFWFGSCLLMITYLYFRLPETKDRSFAELDILFSNKVPARKFKSTKVDVFKTESHGVTLVTSRNSKTPSDEEKVTDSK